MESKKILLLIINLFCLVQIPLYGIVVEITNDGDNDLFLTSNEYGQNVSPETITQASKTQKGSIVSKGQSNKLAVNDGILVYEKKFGSNFVYKGKLVETSFKLPYSTLQASNLSQKSDNKLAFVPPSSQ